MLDPLDGQRIVVTRTRSQASALVAALAELGAETVEVPTIAIEAPSDGGVAAAHVVGALESFAWVVVTSPNGAQWFCDSLRGSEPGDGVSLPAGVRLAAVGPSTARRLESEGLTVDLVPERFVAEGLVDAFETVGPPSPANNQVLLAVAEVTRPTLADGLAAQGWSPQQVPFYRTVPAPIAQAQLDGIGAATAVTFTSSSTVEQFVALVGREAVPPVVACIGPITSTTARDCGLVVDIEAGVHTIEGLAAALAAHFTK